MAHFFNNILIDVSQKKFKLLGLSDIARVRHDYSFHALFAYADKNADAYAQSAVFFMLIKADNSRIIHMHICNRLKFLIFVETLDVK